VNPQPFAAALTLARILRPWGRRGEVAAEILTDFPKRLTQLRAAWLCDGRTPPRPVQIRSCRIHLGQAIFHFNGSESISDAERLRGLEVQVPLEERTPIGPSRYYISDLVGCSVCEVGNPGSLGIVSDVQRVSAPAATATPNDKQSVEAWVLVVPTARGELLIPLAAEICIRIDTATQRIEVRLPEGLRDLNTSNPELV